MIGTRQRYAAGLGLAGALLGIVAGIAQATAGETLGSWAGNKNDPVPLGLLTIVLSAVAVAAARLARSGADASAGRRAATVAGLALPGLICFTTVGRLWWPPGALLLAAAVLLTIAAPAGVARAVLEARLAVLTGVLGASLALVAATASPPMLAFGLASGLAVAAAPWTAGRNRTAALLILLLGAVPFAALTWATLLTPVIAVLAVATGLAAIGPRTRHTRAPATPHSATTAGG